MSIYELKPRFQALLRPMTAALYRAGVTANQVTVAACVVSLALGAWLALDAASPRVFLAVPLWLFARMALNAIDGMLAREHGQASPLGAYLNELTDVVSDAALYAPFALLPGSSPGLVGLVIVLAVVSEMAGVLGRQHAGGRRYDGPMGKSDRAFVFGALGLALGVGVAAGAWFDMLMMVLIALAAVTLFNRMRGALKELAAK